MAMNSEVVLGRKRWRQGGKAHSSECPQTMNFLSISFPLPPRAVHLPPSLPPCNFKNTIFFCRFPTLSSLAPPLVLRPCVLLMFGASPEQTGWLSFTMGPGWKAGRRTQRLCFFTSGRTAAEGGYCWATARLSLCITSAWTETHAGRL